MSILVQAKCLCPVAIFSWEAYSHDFLSSMILIYIAQLH